MNERALRYVHNDFSSEYDRLTNKMTLACRRCQDMLIIVFIKALTNRWPAYIKSLFKLRDNVKNLRGVNKLVLPKVKTTQHGLKSTVYTASKAWNSLSDELRLMTNINPLITVPAVTGHDFAHVRVLFLPPLEGHFLSPIALIVFRMD